MIDRRLVRLAGGMRAALRFAPAHVRIHRAADDRARADDRDLDREVLEIARPAAADHLDLRSALDLEQPDGVAGADAVVNRRVLEIDAREIRWCPGAARDQLDAFFHERQHAEREEVDLDEARIVAGVLVPLADDAVFHRGALERHQLDERARGDDHAPRMLRYMARQPANVLRQLAQLFPERRIFATGKPW